METPLLSIVTGTFDRPQSLDRLINSIGIYTKSNYELIISDASRKVYIPTESNITVLRDYPPSGYAKAYNNAFLQAKGKWVIFLGDDVEVCEGWDTAAIQYMENNPSCGLGCIYYSEWGGSFHINEYQELLYANFGIISRELGNQIGWFDDDIIYCYGADNSLTFKVYLSGLGVCGIGGSKVLHQSITDLNKRAHIARQYEDATALMNRYRPFLDYMKNVANCYQKSPLIHD